MPWRPRVVQLVYEMCGLHGSHSAEIAGAADILVGRRWDVGGDEVGRVPKLLTDLDEDKKVVLLHPPTKRIGQHDDDPLTQALKRAGPIPARRRLHREIFMRIGSRTGSPSPS